MKKILSLILAALLVLSMGAVALADDVDDVYNNEFNGEGYSQSATLSWKESDVITVSITWDSLAYTYSPATNQITKDSENSTFFIENYSTDTALDVTCEVGIAEALNEKVQAEVAADDLTANDGVWYVAANTSGADGSTMVNFNVNFSLIDGQTLTKDDLTALGDSSEMATITVRIAVHTEESGT